MHIEHIAIWVSDLERVREFYQTYFNMVCGEKYLNPQTQFSSYFLSFPNTSTRLELIHSPNILKSIKPHNITGIAHFSFAVGSAQQVDALTDRLMKDGFPVIAPPRTTGDGYYESEVEDCEGNRIELTI
jgi:lactoylglutathione lyase